MIPRLYRADETAFTEHGYGTLSATISCTVTEERNGTYELKMTYPIDGRHYTDIALQRIVLAKPNFTDDPQPFRIYKITKPLNGVVTIYGQHISYDLSGVIIQSGTAGNAAAAALLLQDAAPGWTITTDKSVTAVWKVSEPSSIRSWFCGKAGSLLDVYGPGEWHFDKFTCSFLAARGSNRGVSVRYAKNLTELSQEINCSNLAKYVLGYYKDMDGNVVCGTMQDTGCLLSDKKIVIDFSSDFTETPTQAALNTRTQQYIAANNLTVPTDNIKLDFVQLGTLTDRVDLCDTITVYYEALGVSTTAKCIKTVWDVLLERYTEIEVGDSKNNLEDTILKVEKTASEASSKSVSLMQAAIDHATSLITGNLGGHIVLHDSNGDGSPDEILIMDTADINTAVKVWRWNSAGLGYSSTGYDGNYGLAMTMDGQIVADYVNTGVIRGNGVEVNLNAGTIKANSLDILVNGAETDVLDAISGTVQDNIGVNLSPFFSQPFSDIYSATNNPSGYWWSSLSTNRITQLTDGWAQVEVDNSSGTGTIWPLFYVRYNPDLFDYTDDEYTILVEIKDAVITGGIAKVWFSNTISSNIPAYYVVSTAWTPTMDFNTDAVIRGRLIKTNNTNPNLWFRCGFEMGAGVNASFMARISMFKAGYEGEYVPFVPSQSLVYENKANIILNANSIQSEVAKRISQGASLTQDINDNANALQTAINDTNATVTELSSSLTQTATEINATITQTQTNLQDYAEQQAQTAADDLAATLATYIRYYQSGGTGVLELGDNASGYVAKLNNQKLSFYDGDTEVAYISNNKLYITNGEIQNNLQIGKYQWITDSTGRMSLKWVG